MHQSIHEQSVTAAIQRPPSDRINLHQVDRKNDVGQLLEVLQSELSDLSKKRQDIARRIRILDKTLRGLRAGVGQNFLAPKAATASPRLEQNDLNPTLPQLSRACRIALAEAGGPASPEEIHARILRRGSFSFVRNEAAIATIAQVLDSMATQGDARRLHDRPQGLGEARRPERFMIAPTTQQTNKPSRNNSFTS
jgi:hypothetical protein